MVAEKPSIAHSISIILSKNNYKKYFHQTMYIYTFKGNFKGRKAFFTVTSVKGHIYENLYGHKYKKNNLVESFDYNIYKISKIKKLIFLNF